MPSLKQNCSLGDYQNFIGEVYGLPNDRFFSIQDMATNVERFIMRGLKGIRKNDPAKTKLNLLISLSWFMSLANRLHVDLEKEVWKKFPYCCSYCATAPCVCLEKKIKKRISAPPEEAKRPKTISGFQKMLKDIYPPQKRTLEHAGVHLAEEIGEVSEALLTYLGNHQRKNFQQIESEMADLFTCFLGVFNSLKVDLAEELSKTFSSNCHVCKNSPCTCDFKTVTEFKS